MPWVENNHGITKQILVRKICKAGYSTNLAFQYIYQIKLFISIDEVEVDEIVDLELLKKIDPDYMVM